MTYEKAQRILLYRLATEDVPTEVEALKTAIRALDRVVKRNEYDRKRRRVERKNKKPSQSVQRRRFDLALLKLRRSDLGLSDEALKLMAHLQCSDNGAQA